jgi:transposase
MPKKIKVSDEVLQLAKETAKDAKNTDELRTAQSVLIPGLLNVPDRITGQIIGRSRGTVVQMRKKFGELEQSQDRNWGGRRYAYMTIEEEQQFMSEFLDKASRGGILVVSDIKRAFEAQVGQEVAKTTIYRMLDRHDWRSIIPRPRHPNSNTEAQEGFKKTPENSG